MFFKVTMEDPYEVAAVILVVNVKVLEVLSKVQGEVVEVTEDVLHERSLGVSFGGFSRLLCCPISPSVGFW